MGTLELGEANRKRYPEVPERISFVNHQVGMRALKQLRVQAGYEYADMFRRLGGTEDEPGRLDEDALAAFVWLILWQAGHQYPWGSFDVTLAGLTVDFRAGDVEDQVDDEQAEAEPEATDGP